MTATDYKEFYELLNALREDAITDVQFEQLDSWISSDQHACRIYVEYVKIWAELQNFQTAAKPGYDPVIAPFDQQLYAENMDLQLWQQLALEEQVAPKISIPENASARPLISNVVRPKISRNVNRFNLFVAAVSTAALLFILIYMHFAIPGENAELEVATLIDQMNVKWSDSNISLPTGSRLKTKMSPVGLERGMVKLLYDNNVEVIIEGPAAFELERKGLYLEYGRMYGCVSKSGSGFTVNTPTSKFIDLGTEFGIQADVNGSSELHVIKGKVQLFVAVSESPNKSQIVNEKHAIRFDGNTGQIDEIAFKADVFIQQFNSEVGIAWKGQSYIDLSDIVAGGNGFGTRKLGYVINAGTGKQMTSEQLGRNNISDNVFKPFDHPLIDGVFVPNSSQNPQIVSTLGHVFAECPKTDGMYYLGIGNGLFARNNLVNEQVALSLNSMKFGCDNRACIFMHVNQGITFDLDAMRKGVEGARLVRFIATCGIPTNATPGGFADIYVLTDGQVRFIQRHIQQGQSFPIDIALGDQERFLTFVTTTSEDKPKKERTLPNVGDWCMFGDPFISLEAN